MGNGLFLSYRRDDSSGYTELLYARLSAFFGETTVFRDVHRIRPTEDFRDVIRRAIEESAIVAVVISRQWHMLTSADGNRRLFEPDDILRWEISSALCEGKLLLPILVGGASMPSNEELPQDLQRFADRTAFEILDARWEEDLGRLFETIRALVPGLCSRLERVNPFNIRAGIRCDTLFHGRRLELGTMRDYVRGQQNCQLVGDRRIGKSSLLLFAQRHCTEWSGRSRVAYLDLQDPRCYTLAGWLKEIAHGLRLPATPTALPELMEAIEDLIDRGEHPVLLLDEFGEMTRRPLEFPREVFLTLRACGQRGASIITAAPKRLSELTNPHDDTSPFFNTFPVLRVANFSPSEAGSFFSMQLLEGIDFTVREKERILEFARGHPLALQTACYHVLNARYFGEEITSSLARARADCGSAIGAD